MLHLEPKIYKWVMIGCFSLLCLLIGFLTFQTYRYKDRDYQVHQKNSIEQAYGRYVIDEKLFPGGNRLFAQHFEPHLQELLNLRESDPKAFERLKTSRVNAFLATLRAKQSMEKIMNEIYAANRLTRDLEFNLSMEKIAVYDANSSAWIPLFSSDDVGSDGLIAGKLHAKNQNNRLLLLSVSSGLAPAYRFTYSLHVDYPDRNLRIFVEMLPVLFFAVVCVSLIVFINYLTFRSLLLQRKESALKTDFLNHINHEFNTPITTLLLCVNTLNEQREVLKADGIAAMAQVMERQANRLKLYCRQVMEAVNIQEQEAQLQRVNIVDLTKQLLSDLALRYSNQIVIEYEVIEEEVMVAVDASLYFSILDNLIANAVKFKSEQPAKIEFSWITLFHGLRLVVSDNGIGIPWEHHLLIFDKFYRANYAGNLPGLGLGLYYVKSCVDRLGWAISLARKDAPGALFFLDITTANENR